MLATNLFSDTVGDFGAYVGERRISSSLPNKEFSVVLRGKSIVRCVGFGTLTVRCGGIGTFTVLWGGVGAFTVLTSDLISLCSFSDDTCMFKLVGCIPPLGGGVFECICSDIDRIGSINTIESRREVEVSRVRAEASTVGIVSKLIKSPLDSAMEVDCDEIPSCCCCCRGIGGLRCMVR